MLQSDRPAISLTSFSQEFGRVMRSVDRAAAKGGMLLGEARILLELSGSPQTSADLARSLVLDSGQISRELAGLERKGLLDRSERGRGNRKVLLRLTESGKIAAREVMARQSAQAALVLQGMSQAQRDRLHRAAMELGDLLYVTGEGKWGTHLREGIPGDAGLLIFGIVQSRVGPGPDQFDECYEGYVTAVFADFLEKFDSKRDLFLVAERLGVLAGSIIMPRRPDAAGHISMLHVHRDHMNQRVDALLLDECVSRARMLGYRCLTARTSSRAFGEGIFAERGWEPIDSRADLARYGPKIKSQRWRLDLRQRSRPVDR